MKFIKAISAALVLSIGLYYAYFYFTTEETPEECYVYRETYNEFLNLLKQQNTDGSFDDTLQELSSIGNEFDSRLNDNKRLKKEDAKNWRYACVKTHEFLSNMSTMLKGI
jgi:hypothetical protein